MGEQQEQQQEHGLDYDFISFIEKVKRYSAIDLSQYKEAQMKRRLRTLYMKKGYSSFNSFFDAMVKDKSLYDEFLDRMTINVSEFWRNPNRWAVLAERLLPELARGAVRLKCWSAACSTGEEPYTLAMILAELGLLEKTSLLATDIDEAALEKARRAEYAERSLRDVPDPYIRKYFTQRELVYTVEAAFRKHVRFAKHNLLLDAFDSGYDLIVCRNVTIYFTDEAKRMLYRKFSQSLRPGGLLFVGSTEQILSPAQYELEPVDTFVYRKKAEDV